MSHGKYKAKSSAGANFYCAFEISGIAYTDFLKIVSPYKFDAILILEK